MSPHLALLDTLARDAKSAEDEQAAYAAALDLAHRDDTTFALIANIAARTKHDSVRLLLQRVMTQRADATTTELANLVVSGMTGVIILHATYALIRREGVSAEHLFETAKCTKHKTAALRLQEALLAHRGATEPMLLWARSHPRSNTVAIVARHDLGED